MNKVILTLPAFNEAEGIGPLLKQADSVLLEMAPQGAIVLVDDGSSDGTAEAARTANPRTPLTIVSHARNQGLGHAIMTGLREALRHIEDDDDFIVCMDADNTHPPSAIPHMIGKAATGYDIVIASRYRRGSRQVGVPLWRRFLSIGARELFIRKLALEGVRDYTCGFRAYRVRTVREGLAKYGDALISREGFACTDELLVKLADFQPRIAEVPFVLRYDQKKGRSKIQLLKTIRETLKMLRAKGH